MNLLPSLSAYPGLGYAFSTTEDGNLSYAWGEPGEVLASRKAFLEKLRLKPEDCVGMPLDHGGSFEEVGEEQRGRDMTPPVQKPFLDALITRTPGLPLFMVTADCLPVIVYDPEHKALGLAHLSWKTAQGGLARRTVESLRDRFGSQPQDLITGIGPGIHAESYAFETSEQEALAEWQPFLAKREGLTHIDLPGFVMNQLTKAGVRPEHIELSPIDTAVDPHFYSHYRSARSGEPEARFATVAWIRP